MTALPPSRVSLAQRSLFFHAPLFLQSRLVFQDPSGRRNNLALRKNLQRQVTVTWRGQELGTALYRLTRAAEATLWLDRRVDRQQAINAQYVDLSLEQAFERLTGNHSLGFSLLSDLVYVGPRQATQELATLSQQARASLSDAPAARRRRWLLAQPKSWPRLSEPRVLVTDWLTAANIELVGSELIAHDLWPAQSLPAVPLLDRLVLLLAGFELTCKISPDGKTCEIVPIQRPVELAQQHRDTQAEPESRLPRAAVPGEAQRRKARPGEAGRASSQQVFSLRLENQPLGPVLDQFAQQLQLEVIWQGEASDQQIALRKKLVSCDVQNVDLDELLGSVLAAAGMRHHLEGKQVTILVKP